MKKIFSLLIVCIALGATSLQAQVYVNLGINQPISLGADAGVDTLVCLGDSLVLGGAPTAINGTGPYSYVWSPSSFINDTSIANPMFDGNTLGTYQYVVMITDTNNCTSYDTINISVEVCAGIDEKQPEVLSVYPNPTKDRFHIAFGNVNNKKALVEVMNATGQIIIKEQINGPANSVIEFDLSNYGKGMYSVKTTLDGKKVVVNQILVK